MGTEQLLKTLHTCFIAFLIIAVVFIIASVALFFLLDIKNVFNNLTGRAVKKTIEQMEAANNSTGRLRKVNKIAMGEMTPTSMTDDLVAENVTERLEENEANVNSEGGEQTTLLDEGGEYTTLLNAGETSVLSNAELQEQQTIQEENVNIGTFIVIKKEMFVHTDEVV